MSDDRLEKEIIRLEIEEVSIISLEAIKELFSILKKIDSDMSPLLDIIFRLMEHVDDEKVRSLSMIKILKFYGINNSDILASRQKMVVEEGILAKKPFLKKNQKENIILLLKQLNIEM